MSNDDSFNDSDELFSLYSSKNVTETFKTQLKKIVANSNHVTDAFSRVNNEAISSKEQKNTGKTSRVASRAENFPRRTAVEKAEGINGDDSVDDAIQIIKEFSPKLRQSERLRVKGNKNCSELQVLGVNLNAGDDGQTTCKRQRPVKKTQRRGKLIDEITLDDSPQPVENEDEINPEISVKVIWKSVNVKKFQIRKFQKLLHIYELLSKEENVPEDKIILTFNNIRVNQNDTPDSLNLQVYHFLDGGVLSESTSLHPTSDSHALESDSNSVTVKFQDINKKLIVLNLNKSEKLKVGMIMCSEQLEIPLNKIKFFFDGELIQPSETPESLGLENGEIIDIKISDS